MKDVTANIFFKHYRKMSEAKHSIDASSGAMKKSETESIENLMDQNEPEEDDVEQGKENSTVKRLRKYED